MELWGEGGGLRGAARQQKGDSHVSPAKEKRLKKKEATRNGVREGPKSITNLSKIQQLFVFFFFNK